MPKIVSNGAKLKCSEGMAPSLLTVLPLHRADADELPIATVMDNQAMINIAPFGMCKAQANPQVAAATAAAMGTPTPAPCVPVITAPWSPGAAIVTIRGQQALTSDSTCACAWAGRVAITDPVTDIDVD